MKTLAKLVYPALAALVLTWFSPSLLAQVGQVYAWGYNGNGQLGDGTTTDASTPVAVDMSGALSGKAVTAIAVALHTVAVTSDGQLFAWGWNAYGQLGDGTTTDRSTPVAVDMSGALAGKTVTAIAAGEYHTVALTSDGQLFAWGDNTYGQLGNGTMINSTTPVAVDMSGALSGKIVTAISALYQHTLALTSDGQLFVWGDDPNCVSGYCSAPMQVSDPFGALVGNTVIAIAAGAYHDVVLTSDGQLIGWGDNSFGQTGWNGGNSFPTAMVPWQYEPLSGEITAIGAGALSTMVLTSDGQIFSIGFGGGGPGCGGYGPDFEPLFNPIEGKTVTAFSAGALNVIALMSDGTLFALGDNEYGEVGAGYVSGCGADAVDMSGALSGKIVTALQPGWYHTVAIATPGFSASTTAGSGIIVNGTVGSTMVNLTFHDVTVAGDTTVKAIDPSSAGTLPSAYELVNGNLAFDITTTATYTTPPPILIAFQVPSVDAATFPQLRVLHNENGTWVDVTATDPAPDPTTQTIYASVNSLSPFVIAKFKYRAQVQQPINVDGSSIFTANRGVVPVKFTLTSDSVPTCQLPPAMIAVTRTAGGTIGSVNESTYTMPSDSGSNFRVDNCQYVYNLNSSGLGVGTYRVDIQMNGITIGSGAFALK